MPTEQRAGAATKPTFRAAGGSRDSEKRVEKKRIVVVASLAYSLINFRLELLRSMVAAGHEVIALAPDADDAVAQRLAGIGVKFGTIPMNRTGMNPLADFRTLSALAVRFRKWKPDVVLAYTMKPVIYAGLAARTARVPAFFALMTGLGYMFSDDDLDVRKRVVRGISVALYRSGLKKAKKLFVYNSADMEDIRRHRMVRNFDRLAPVAGSGVDLALYRQSAPETGRLSFLLIARLLRDKGVREFVAAAREIKERHPDACFQILGPLDSNPTAITRDEIDTWVGEGIVEYLGETRDVRPYLAHCSVFVLPSYYREGIPRTLLEALATGRAIITTDLPGCADTVEPGRNGYRVKPRDAGDLAKAMQRFIDEPKKIREMGQASRGLAESRFDVHAVNRQLLRGMDLI